MARRAFTISIPSEHHAEEADYMGMASGRNEDKFKKAGLTPVQAEYVDAPYVGECPMVLECQLIHTIEIGLHTQFVGEIKDVKVDQGVLRGDGLPDPEKVKPILYAPVFRSYFGLGKHIGEAFTIGKGI
jgi:flavin reductase (DIM6/NTAB) family NADH-FMN oxidoreductase RutF